MKRTNPFKPLYDSCNSGDPQDKLSHLPPFPHYLDVEITNICNFQCLMCPVGTGMMKRTQGMMDATIFNQIVQECKPFKAALRFIRWGEPTLHPKLLEFIKLAKNNGLLCHLNTNGSKLSPELIDEFIKIPLDSIKFSFQGIDKKSYGEMRNRDFFDSLVENIKLLYQTRGDHLFPYIHIATTTTYETEEQIASFSSRMKNYSDLVTIGKTKMNIIELNNVKLSPETIKRLKFLKTQESIIKEHLPICPEVFDKLSINWDGTVSACCADYDNKMIVGDLKKNSLMDIWHSEKMEKYRKIIAAKRYDAIELCRTCYDTMGIQKNWEYKKNATNCPEEL